MNRLAERFQPILRSMQAQQELAKVMCLILAAKIDPVQARCPGVDRLSDDAIEAGAIFAILWPAHVGKADWLPPIRRCGISGNGYVIVEFGWATGNYETELIASTAHEALAFVDRLERTLREKMDAPTG